MTAMVWRFLLELSILQIVLSSCPSGFDLVSNGECRGSYANISVTADKAPQAAIDKCAEILGQPVIIHNQEEQSFWAARSVGQSPAFPFLLLGIVCNSSSKSYEWTDGSAIDFKPPIYSAELDGNCTTTLVNWYSWFILSDGKWSGWVWGGQEFPVDISCTVPLHQPIPSADGCNSFEDDSDDGICYQIGTQAESWHDAQLICTKLGANLASIHNLQENSFIRRLAVSNGAVNGVFLGATISGKGNEFGWIDGSDWDYQNFYPGFPIPGIGDCLAMDTSTSAGQWMNKNCSAKLPVACVRAQGTPVVSPTCSPGLSMEGKIITSPGFPYDASMPCDFFLTVEEGKKVEAEIYLEANPCCDYLIIHDDFLGGNLIANITGEIRNVTYTSPSNYMRVSWQPNGGVNVRGLAMFFRGV